jgi:hypothetical protein
MLIPRTALCLASMLALGAGNVSGQDYPAKTIRIIASAPGGGGDFTARLIAGGISGPLGQPVIVDNRGGGFLPAEALVKSDTPFWFRAVRRGSIRCCRKRRTSRSATLPPSFWFRGMSTRLRCIRRCR